MSTTSRRSYCGNPENCRIHVSIVFRLANRPTPDRCLEPTPEAERKRLNHARDFHSLYGEFFATWKLWNYYIRDIGAGPLADASRWDLLMRACDAEGKLESTLVRLACERPLENADIENLGRFRQLYQGLREAIRDNRPLNWNSSEHPEYAEFKALAPKVAFLIVGKGRGSIMENSAEMALTQITSNKWEPANHPRASRR